MAAVYPDVIWIALKARVSGTTIPASDLVSGADGFKVVNSLAELEGIECDRVTAVIVVQGPDTPAPMRGTCKDTIRFLVATRYLITDEGIARALRDAPLMRARIKSLHVDEIAANPPRVDPPTWDYQTFAGENALLVGMPVAIDFEAIRPEVG